MNYFTNISQLVFDLGGTGVVAKKLNLQPSTVSNWKRNNKIPNSYYEKINSLSLELNKKFNNPEMPPNLFLSKSKHFKLLLIISGGVACYKSLDLIREFKKVNIVDINVILTESAQKFINPIMITSLNGKKCYTHLFSEENEENMNHIKLARENDLILVAPATANLIGKLANGLADDLASNVLLATNNKIVIAPSMNPFMWLNEATQKNINMIKARGIEFIEPERGQMACGEEGIGRLPETKNIFDFVLKKLGPSRPIVGRMKKYNHSKYKNLKVIVTAGPTQEDIDPIRFISNKSSGKQGYAIAEAFKRKDAHVTLITGPTSIKKPELDEVIEVKTADEMLDISMSKLPADIFISVAAIADWKLIPSNKNCDYKNINKKLKKNKFENEEITFTTKANPDILKTIALSQKRPKLVVGFAAETEDLVQNAKEKLKSKNLDIIVANKIDCHNKVFGSDFNKVSFVEKNRLENYDKKTKKEIAEILVKKIFTRYM